MKARASNLRCPMTTIANDPTELPIPQPRRQVLGSLLFFALFGAFLAFFCMLAVKNLLAFHFITFGPFVASALWILLVTAILAGFVYDTGARQFFIDFLANFSSHHVLRFAHDDGAPLLHFTFTFCGV